MEAPALALSGVSQGNRVKDFKRRPEAKATLKRKWSNSKKGRHRQPLDSLVEQEV